MWNWHGRLVCHQVLEQRGHYDGGPEEFRSLGRLLYTMGTLISQLQAQRHDGIVTSNRRSITLEFRRAIRTRRRSRSSVQGHEDRTDEVSDA